MGKSNSYVICEARIASSCPISYVCKLSQKPMRALIKGGFQKMSRPPITTTLSYHHHLPTQR
jgi:hypothetical protein